MKAGLFVALVAVVIVVPLAAWVCSPNRISLFAHDSKIRAGVVPGSPTSERLSGVRDRRDIAIYLISPADDLRISVSSAALLNERIKKHMVVLDFQAMRSAEIEVSPGDTIRSVLQKGGHMKMASHLIRLVKSDRIIQRAPGSDDAVARRFLETQVDPGDLVIITGFD
jgi:hypothetical protein